MWVAKLSPLSAPRNSRNYNYFHDVMGFIGFKDTLQELLDYIRNPEDGYEELHIENTTGKDNEADSDGIKYYLTINSLYMGFPIEFEIYDLNDIDGCNELAKEELTEVREYVNAKNQEESNVVSTKLSADDKAEFYGQLIDVVEDFLDAREITRDDLKNPDRDDIEDQENIEDAAIIYGEDYDELREGFSAVIENWFDAKS